MLANKERNKILQNFYTLITDVRNNQEDARQFLSENKSILNDKNLFIFCLQYNDYNYLRLVLSLGANIDYNKDEIYEVPFFYISNKVKTVITRTFIIADKIINSEKLSLSELYVLNSNPNDIIERIYNKVILNNLDSSSEEISEQLMTLVTKMSDAIDVHNYKDMVDDHEEFLEKYEFESFAKFYDDLEKLTISPMDIFTKTLTPIHTIANLESSIPNDVFLVEYQTILDLEKELSRKFMPKSLKSASFMNFIKLLSSIDVMGLPSSCAKITYIDLLKKIENNIELNEAEKASFEYYSIFPNFRNPGSLFLDIFNNKDILDDLKSNPEFKDLMSKIYKSKFLPGEVVEKINISFPEVEDAVKFTVLHGDSTVSEGQFLLVDNPQKDPLAEEYIPVQQFLQAQEKRTLDSHSMQSPVLDEDDDDDEFMRYSPESGQTYITRDRQPTAMAGAPAGGNGFSQTSGEVMDDFSTLDYASETKDDHSSRESLLSRNLNKKLTQEIFKRDFQGYDQELKDIIFQFSQNSIEFNNLIVSISVDKNPKNVIQKLLAIEKIFHSSVSTLGTLNQFYSNILQSDNLPLIWANYWAAFYFFSVHRSKSLIISVLKDAINTNQDLSSVYQFASANISTLADIAKLRKSKIENMHEKNFREICDPMMNNGQISKIDELSIDLMSIIEEDETLCNSFLEQAQVYKLAHIGQEATTETLPEESYDKTPKTEVTSKKTEKDDSQQIAVVFGGDDQRGDQEEGSTLPKDETQDQTSEDAVAQEVASEDEYDSDSDIEGGAEESKGGEPGDHAELPLAGGFDDTAGDAHQ